jgi:hypothetical protein
MRCKFKFMENQEGTTKMFRLGCAVLRSELSPWIDAGITSLDRFLRLRAKIGGGGQWNKEIKMSGSWHIAHIL